jgi:hypothetical protein
MLLGIGMYIAKVPLLVRRIVSVDTIDSADSLRMVGCRPPGAGCVACDFPPIDGSVRPHSNDACGVLVDEVLLLVGPDTDSDDLVVSQLP